MNWAWVISWTMLPEFDRPSNKVVGFSLPSSIHALYFTSACSYVLLFNVLTYCILAVELSGFKIWQLWWTSLPFTHRFTSCLRGESQGEMNSESIHKNQYFSGDGRFALVSMNLEHECTESVHILCCLYELSSVRRCPTSYNPVIQQIVRLKGCHWFLVQGRVRITVKLPTLRTPPHQMEKRPTIAHQDHDP